jgi:hypothetical protein
MQKALRYLGLGLLVTVIASVVERYGIVLFLKYPKPALTGTAILFCLLIALSIMPPLRSMPLIYPSGTLY